MTDALQMQVAPVHMEMGPMQLMCSAPPAKNAPRGRCFSAPAHLLSLRILWHALTVPAARGVTTFPRTAMD